MRNYRDLKCIWGYMTLCDKCIINKPSHVYEEIAEKFPAVECEMCGTLAIGYKRLKDGEIIKRRLCYVDYR